MLKRDTLCDHLTAGGISGTTYSTSVFISVFIIIDVMEGNWRKTVHQSRMLGKGNAIVLIGLN